MSRGTNVADIYAEMRLEDRNFNRGMQQADNRIKSTMKNVFSLENAFKLAFAKATVDSIKNFSWEITTLASDVRELENVFRVFTGSSAQKFITATDELGRSIGRGSFQMRQMVSEGMKIGQTMGLTEEGIGAVSIEVSKLAVDMASLFNAQDSVVAQDLRSFFAGSMETLDKYGLSVREATLKQHALAMGYKASYDSLSVQEKGLVRYNWLMENTKHIQGDAVNTLHEFQGQLKLLQGNLQDTKAKWGEGLLDPATKAITLLNNMYDFDQTEIKLKFEAEGLEGVAFVVENMLKDLNNIGAFVKTMGSGVKESFNLLGKGIVGVTDKVGKAGIQIEEKGIIDALSSPFKKAFEEGFINAAEGATLAEKSKAFMDSLYGHTKTIEDYQNEYWEKKRREHALEVYQEEKEVAKELEVYDSSVVAEAELEEARKKHEEARVKAVKDSYERENALIIQLSEDFGKEKLQTEIERLKNVEAFIQEARETENIELSNYFLELRKDIYDGVELLIDEETQRMIEQEKDKRARNIELEKKVLKSEEDLNKIKRELYMEQFNDLQSIRSRMSTMNREQALSFIEDSFDSENIELFHELSVIFDDLFPLVEKNVDSSKDYAKSLSQVAQITSELSDIFKDDLLNSMAMVMNQAGSMVTNWQMGGLGQGLAVVQGVGLATSLMREWNKDDRSERQTEDYKRFEDSVKNFERAVNDLSIAGSISFAQLEKPTNFAGISAGKGSAGGNAWLQALTGNPFLGGFFGKKPKDASLDTSELQKQLNEAGYGNINVGAIAGKYEQYGSSRNWYGKKESYVKGYDTVGIVAEINELIEQAYRLNLDNFKNAVGLTSQNFSKGLEQAFRGDGDAQKAINDIMTNAMITAVFNSQAFEEAGKMLGDSFSEDFFANFEDFDIGDFANLSLEERMEMYVRMFDEGYDYLEEQFERLGLQLDRTTEGLNKLSGSTRNLPQGVKMAQAINQASNPVTIQIYGDMYGDNIQKKIIQGLQYNQGLATGNYTRM